MLTNITIVFVHGYSVTNLDTYGELPIRLKSEAQQSNINIEIEEIFLGKYISFNDDVKLSDISNAFNAAINIQLKHLIKNNNKFICITHSTGAPVVRDWCNRFYKNTNSPMSHLIMLAPANFGSALAQLGKGKLSRLKSWFDGVEPGQGVLDWLELGSDESWKLNKSWIKNEEKFLEKNSYYPFVITGQSIDRKLYDNLNSYTGELGSDGVVRVATCNLNAQYTKLIQPNPQKDNKGNLFTKDFVVDEYCKAPNTAFKIVANKSHSGDEMGILKSVKADLKDNKNIDTVNSILQCIKVSNYAQYTKIIDAFKMETKEVQKNELIEEDLNFLLFNRLFIHDRYSQIIFKVYDTEGYPINDFDLILTAGSENNPNHLPEGFFVDRQKNKKHNNTLTYFLNYNVMIGFPEIKNKNNDIIRQQLPGTNMLGFEIIPRPNQGFVKYIPCKIKANQDLLNKAIQPNSTTLIEIILQRNVSNNVFEMIKINKMPTKKEGNFSDSKPSKNFI